MPKLHGEKTFEAVIEKSLIEENGFLAGNLADYDKKLCLLRPSVVGFLQTTQPDKWKSYRDQVGDEAKQNVLRRINKVIEKKGTHHLLRKGFDESGHHFDMCFFPPVSGLNPEVKQQFEQNVFQVIRDDFKYSEKNQKSVDMVLFLNGCPLFTVELKNPKTGQTYKHAIRQYQQDRDPKEPLFMFGRCLAHFAVDTEEVYFATELKGRGTFFLPFNRGHDGGAGNPPSALGFGTAYLWNEIWNRESLLNLIQRFIRVIKDRDNKGKATGKQKLIFPRFQQLDTVRKLTKHAQNHGTGQHYLNQHSAGSGKTICIATLANSLAVLHDKDDKPVFNSVIVVSDRRVIDRQLQNDLDDFTDTPGLLENIDKKSIQLREALENGKKIIVTTIQKFGHILKDLGTMRQQSFAVIIDEAHSSQAGKAASQMNEALANSPQSQDPEEEELTWEDKINAEMKAAGRLPHVSYFGFTATPKKQTLELFGVEQTDGKYRPFSHYSMRQAIEEGFIVDVLQNYTTYDQYFNLLQTVADDPVVDKNKARKLLKQYVANQRVPIERKCHIMIDHFRGHVEPNMQGKAKAMIVASSRANAVRYCLESRKYLEEQGSPFRVLVAFTDSLKLPECGDREFTEANLNGFPEIQTADQFENNEYRILVVANKYQTGFDQPLLQAMYVDRKLRGVAAVQTLSRLNRVHPLKRRTTFVLDFENDSQDIVSSFQPYYDRMHLTASTEPDVLYDIRTDLKEARIYGPNHLDEYAKIIASKQTEEVKRRKIEVLVRPVVTAFENLEEDDRLNFRSKLRDYVKAYAFLCQIIPFEDQELYKLYRFGDWLSRSLPGEETLWPREILSAVDLSNYRPEQVGSANLGLTRGDEGLDPVAFGDDAIAVEDELEQLSRIIEELNDNFGTSFTDEDRIVIRQLQEGIGQDQQLNNSVSSASRDAARAAYEEVARDKMQGLMNSHFKFYKKVQDDEELSKLLFDRLFAEYFSDVQNQKDAPEDAS